MISLVQRFWNKVNKQGPYPHKKACELYPEIKGTRCWMWTAAGSKGYGQFRYKGRTISAHRISWVLQFGKIPKGKHVLHKCDNKACMRHLFTGTNKDNMDDRDLKGRNLKGLALSIAVKKNRPYFKGECHPRTKLTNNDVLRIRKLAKSQSAKDLATLFQVNRGSVYNIIARRSFSHI